MNNDNALTLRLRTAEAAFARSVVRETGSGAAWAAEQAHIVRLRHHCREMSSALETHDAAGAPVSFDKAREGCRELRLACMALIPSAAIPFHCLDESCLLLRQPRTTCWIGVIESNVARFAKEHATGPVFGSRASFQPDHAAKSTSDKAAATPSTGARDFRKTRLILRQGLDLLALVSAYLAYYFLDVQLQIVSLPVAAAWLMH